VRAAPDSGRAWAILGAALTRSNEWAHAQAVFDTAFIKMTSREAAPYFSLGPILKVQDDARWKAMTPAQRSQLYSSYWAVAQPLFLNTLNEPRTEFFARLTEVLHRWSDPLRGYVGYESDRGRIYVRYGPPSVWATLGRGRASETQTLPNGQTVTDPLGWMESQRTSILWVYRDSQLRFLFSLTPGFTRANLASEFPQYYARRRTSCRSGSTTCRPCICSTRSSSSLPNSAVTPAAPISRSTRSRRWAAW